MSTTMGRDPSHEWEATATASSDDESGHVAEQVRGDYVARIVGVLLVVLGGLFLLVRLYPISLGRYGWPFFVILPGLALFGAMALGGRRAGGPAIPGSIVSTVGLILLLRR